MRSDTMPARKPSVSVAADDEVDEWLAMRDLERERGEVAP